MPGDAESELAAERKKLYQGTFKIDLDQISPHPSCRKLNEKNVKRLCSIFHTETCRRLDIGNRVTAVVCRQHLETALRAAGHEERSESESSCYKTLQFAAGQVKCLHGQHRLRAAAKLLPVTDRWWLVDLYLDGIQPLCTLIFPDQLTAYRCQPKPSGRTCG